MLKSAIELAIERGNISTSVLQRTLLLGYGRASKLLDRMQAMGIIGPQEGKKPRRVLVTAQQYGEMTLE